MAENAPEERGATLLGIARDSLERTLLTVSGEPETYDDEPWLHRPGASFITLRQARELRGCIGSIEAVRPLLEDVRSNARGAALEDPRFPPLVAAELDGVEIEVTLLSPLEPLPFSSEADALARLRPGIDGVVLRYERRRATFLPQVWDSLAEPAAFLAQLKRKAGLPPDFWHPELELQRYTARKWRESGLVAG